MSLRWALALLDPHLDPETQTLKPKPRPTNKPASSYEELRIPRDEAWAKYLKEGMDISVLQWGDRVISVDLPITVELVITETDPGLKGNTASGGSKPATLETGAVVQVPLFVQQGEKVKVDTRTDTYLSRASDSGGFKG